MECYRGVTKVAQKYGVTYVSYLRYHKQNVEAIGRNIKTFYEMGSSLASLRNLYKDKPAIIVASGPSLLNNIELLKDIQDKVLILAPYTSLKVIEPLGIKPDFVFSIDPNQVEEVHHKDIDSYNYNFVMDCAGNTSLLKKNTGNNFLYVDASSPHFRKYFNVENFGDANLDSGGSVANNAASFAHLVGCNRLILIGQDLAFKGERSHAYDDLLDDIETKRYKVKGFYGDEVETYRVYDTYKRWFESFGNVYGEKIHCINATEGGAYINYFEHMSFKEAIEMYLTESFDTTVPEEIIKKPTLQQTKDAIQIIQEEIDFYKTNIVKLRSIIKPVTKIKKAFEKDNDVDTSKFANDLKKLDKFDEFYKENRDKYQICKTVQYMTFLQHQVGFPLDFSADRIVAEKNYRHYTELLDGIELGHETLEKAKKDLVELTEGKDGVQ